MGKIGDDDALVADLAGELMHLLMRALEEIVEDAELVHHLKRRGVDGVAAEVAQEIGVLLQHHDIDAGARQQKAEHHAGGTAAGDDALRGDGLRRHQPPVSAMAGRWWDKSWKSLVRPFNGLSGSQP